MGGRFLACSLCNVSVRVKDVHIVNEVLKLAFFRAQHPGATVYNQDVNLLLEKAVQEVKTGNPYPRLKSLSEGQEDLPSLPFPGEVGLLPLGFPCQSFSGLNRYSICLTRRTT